MNAKERFQYIWDYYKLPILGIPLAVLILLFVIKSFSADTEPDFSLYVINHTVTEESRQALEASLGEMLCADADGATVYVDASLTVTPSSPDYESQMSFTTAIAGHTIDVMLADDEFFTYYAAKDAFYDLSALLPAELYETLTPCLLYAADADGKLHAYGLDVSDCPLFAELGSKGSVLTVAKGTEHADMVLAFLHKIFADELSAVDVF